MRGIWLIIAVALPNLAMTCGIGEQIPDETTPLEGEVEEILKYTAGILKRKGFRIDDLNVRRRKLTTEWKTGSGIHSRQQIRERVTVTLEKRPKGLIAILDCTKEMNENSADREVSWIRISNNSDLQMGLVLLLKMKFDPEWKDQ